MANIEEPIYYSDGIAPVRRSAPEQLFLVSIEARPNPDLADEEVGGAFVTCWVNTDDLRTAERRAVALIEEYGWWPYRFHSWELVTRDGYANWQPCEPDALDPRELVDQAFIDGEACKFHIWPAAAPDADEA